MKRIVMALLLLVLAGTLQRCTKGGDLREMNGATYLVSGNASTGQIVPAAAGGATGSFSGLMDENLSSLNFTLTWKDIWTDANKDVMTGIKFYGPATAGASGSLVHSINYINSTNVSGSVTLSLMGSNNLSDSEKQDLIAGKWYYTLCTQKFPQGIIRGQLNTAKWDSSVPSVSPVTGLVFLNTNKTLLKVGDTTTLRVNVQPAFATNKALGWSTSNDAVVKLDQNGKLTAVAKGLATVTATSKDGSGISSSTLVVVDMTIQDLARTGWTVTCSDEKASDGGGKSGIVDGNLTTYWHSSYTPDVPLPHWLLVDMQQAQDIANIRVLRRTGNTDTKTIVVETSVDGASYTPVGSITAFDSNTGTVSFPPSRARYVKLTITESNRPPFANLAEMYVGSYR